MGRKKAKLKIQLCSDLCAGSGYSYAGLIDNDVCYNENGLPFLPARRLKGCLRNAATLVCPEEAEAIFGTWGSNGIKGTIVENAYMINHKELDQELTSLKKSSQEISRCLTQQDILNQYTTVRGQTAINNQTGAALDDTLRHTRVINQYLPGTAHEERMCFYADIEFDDSQEDRIRKIAMATRNIGINRNRGLGSVRCTLEEREPHDADNRKYIESGDSKQAVISYVIQNTEPLMVSSDRNSISDTYIRGQSVLGKLAGEYLSQSGRKAEDVEFQDLFLNGKTVFTNLTLSTKAEDHSWRTYDPAPAYLRQLKKTKKLVNVLADRTGLEGEAYSPAFGNLPRKLKTQYVSQIKPNQYHVEEVQMEIAYHHSRIMKSKEDRDGILYSLETIREGQYFKGKIYTHQRYVPVLEELLSGCALRFGKSKSAQYGKCELVEIKKEEDRERRYPKQTTVIVSLCSDAIFLNERGYTIRYSEVKQIIAEQLGLRHTHGADPYGMIQAKEITGYHTTWNLKRQAVPGVKAGSFFAFVLSEMWTPQKKLFVGERNLEGYGQVRIDTLQTMKYQTDVYVQKEAEAEMNYCKPLAKAIVLEKLLDSLVYRYMIETGKTSTMNMSKSTIGRLILMLKESMREHTDHSHDTFRSFIKRVNSIRRELEKKETAALLTRTVAKESKENGFELCPDQIIGTEPPLEEAVLLSQIIPQMEYKHAVLELWDTYLMEVLVYEKYRKKQE